ncbi:hypothetical protein [Metapseudomonas resinovorans]|uniref:Uncharacterized protein n=1 Tax=Metapseudomonas resinovorans NBRC 106553 TaxID=1245471 RepID=S6ATW9_METRE|nr:hypothetical protein [Pseudomonas resinovorans]BAN47676.1 hypothetical protein PCA10_19440 [Pseudomonas resinovorans NBRC 106553]
MEREYVLAGIAAAIWLMHMGLIAAVSYTGNSDEERTVKLVNGLVLATVAAAGCFTLYLAMTLP